MTNRTHHVFFSYARADNGEYNNHFVTRFHDLLCKEHQAVTGRELKTFFDTKAIEEGEHWKTRLGQGLRDSRLFLAFLSDNYLKSPVCKWEWEHYLLTEHTAARGEDGVVPMYFIPIDELGRATEEQLEEWVDEIKQRNLEAYCQLQPWYQGGSNQVRELDAADRAIALREVDVESEDELSLPERIRRLNLRICRRLDRIHLAEQVIGNVVRSYRHFVGRHKQLRQLHEALTVDQTSLLATVHSPGGLGKSALARQYAIAYADFYAAGGVWELKCAGLAHLGDALRQLEQQQAIKDHGLSLEDVREKTPDEKAQSTLAQLKRITHSRRDTVNQQLRDLKNRHTPEDQLEVRENSRCLLILDNVDKTELLAADQLGLIPAEDWLSVIITTRLSPDSFGAATSLRSIEIPPLSLIEGVELLRTFMPGEAFPDVEEAKAAEALVKALDGYTYALELIGASVSVGWEEGDRLSNHLEMLEEKGLASTDELGADADVQARIRYRNKQISLIVEDTLKTLGERLTEKHGAEMASAAQHIIEMASLLQPDTIPGPWLEALLMQTHPDLKATRERLEPWKAILQSLVQLSLLSPADQDGANSDILRIHRLTAAHIANNLSHEGKWHWAQIESYLAQITGDSEEVSNRLRPDELNQQLQWLLTQAPYLMERSPGQKVRLLMSQLIESLYKSNPENLDACRDFVKLLFRLGTFHMGTQSLYYDEMQAYNYFKKLRSVLNSLYENDKDNDETARLRHDVCCEMAVIYFGMGQRGSLDGALAEYEDAHGYLEQIYARNPEDVEVMSELLRSHQTILNLSEKIQSSSYYDFDTSSTIESSLIGLVEVGTALCAKKPACMQTARKLSSAQSDLADFYEQRREVGDSKLELKYRMATAKTLENTFERDGTEPEVLQHMLIKYWRAALLALKLEDDMGYLQQSWTRTLQLLRTMQANGIPLDKECQKINAKLNQIHSNSQRR